MKPQPKAEIVVTEPPNPHIICIYTSSADAQQWVTDNAGEFGVLTYHDSERYWWLWLSPLYERSEVAEYIRKQGQP